MDHQRSLELPQGPCLEIGEMWPKIHKWEFLKILLNPRVLFGNSFCQYGFSVTLTRSVFKIHLLSNIFNIRELHSIPIDLETEYSKHNNIFIHKEKPISTPSKHVFGKSKTLTETKKHAPRIIKKPPKNSKKTQKIIVLLSKGP